VALASWSIGSCASSLDCERPLIFADQISGPLAHLTSGKFTANAAWLTLAGITHNLLRAAGAARPWARRSSCTAVLACRW
jgi:hypothetical protein